MIAVAETYSLVIWQNSKTTNPEVIRLHLCVNYRYEGNRFLVVEGGIASHSCTQR
jgi:hypothetical protein